MRNLTSTKRFIVELSENDVMLIRAALYETAEQRHEQAKEGGFEDYEKEANRMDELHGSFGRMIAKRFK